ncbi:MAG: dTDP-4-dehydrorhamnose 3,5-epimerase [Planctomycetota bacterium]
MSIVKENTKLEGVYILSPQCHPDGRGYFIETYHQEKYLKAGINKNFIQDNHSHSSRGVIRGLHYQLTAPQAKLIYVISGEIIDVAVDIRKESSTFGSHVAVKLSRENKKQLYIPEGFAHGFCVLSEYADIIYKCSDFYKPGDDFGLLWSDPDLNIKWPVEAPIISEKDLKNPTLKNMPAEKLPQ